MDKKQIQEMARIERNRYHREWCERNKERVRESNARYWERRAARIAAEKNQEANNGSKTSS